MRREMDIGTNWLAIIAYTVLTLLLTYPLIFELGSSIIGWGGDAYSYVNVMWWFNKSIMDPSLSFYNTTYLYHPTGASWAFSEVAPFLLMVSLPLQILFGNIATYNLLILSAFILSAFGAYLLVEYLTGDRRAAFISGVIFAFCPQHFMHALGHVTVASVEFVPFFILYFLKAMKEDDRKNAIYASIFLAIAALCSWYNLIYIFLFIVLYIIFDFVKGKKSVLDKKVFLRLCLIAALSFLLTLPFTYQMFIEIVRGSSYMVRPANETVIYSADLMGFFIPSLLHPLFGKYVAPYYAEFTGNTSENTTYIGYAVIFLIGYYILKHKKKSNEFVFWLLSSTLFFLLSLGPVLHIFGSMEFTQFAVRVPLPYLVMYYLPLVSIARVPGRLSIMFMLSMAVLAGYGAKEVLDSFRNRKIFGTVGKKDVIAAVILLIILFEFMVFPVPISNVIDPPQVYKQMAKENDSYAILEVPFSEGGSMMSEYMYYQTIHGKKLVGGYLSRTPGYALKFIWDTPIISDFWHLSSGNDILKQDPAKIGSSLLNYYDIRYIVIHKDKLKKDEFEYANNLSKSILNNDAPVYEDASLVAYKVKNVYYRVPYMACEDNFYNPEVWNDNRTWRWMNNSARLAIVNTNEKSISISLIFSVVSFGRPRTLEVFVNNVTVRSINVSPQPGANVVIRNIMLNPGKNIVEFYTPEGPATIDSVLHDNDMRVVSFGVTDVSLEVEKIG